MKRYAMKWDTVELILWNIIVVLALLILGSNWMDKAVVDAKRQAHDEAKAKYGTGFKTGYQQGLSRAAEQFTVKSGELPDWKSDRNIYVEE